MSRSSSPESSRSRARSTPSSASRSARARSACSRTSAARASECSRCASADCAASATSRATAASRARRTRRASALARPSRSWAAARSSWSARPDSARTRSSPVRTARRCSTSAWRAARAAVLELVPQGGVGLGVVRPGGARRRCRVPLGELGQRGPVGLEGLGCGRDRALDPLGLAAGGAGLGAELAQLLGHRRHPGVRLVQAVEGCLHVAGRVSLLLERGLQREPHPVDAVTRRDQAGAGLVDRGLHLEQARRGGRAAGGPLPAQQVALGRHRDEPGLVLHEPAGGREVVDHDHVGQQPADGRAQSVRDGHQVERGAGTGGQLGTIGGRRVGRDGAADEQADPAGVVVLEQPDGGLGGGHVADRDGVGGRPEGGGDRALVAGLHASPARPPSRAPRTAGRWRRAASRRRPCGRARARGPPCGRPGQPAAARRRAPPHAAR